MTILSELQFEARASTSKGVAKNAGTGVTLRQLGISILLLSLALACTFLLGALSELTWREVARTVLSTPFWLVAVFTALTVAQISLSAWKWRLVLHKLDPIESERIGFGFLYNCSALASFLSQFLTVYISSVLVRGWALKRSYGSTTTYAATTSVFEQVFDVVALIVMALPTLLIWSAGGSFRQWMLATGLAIIAGAGSLQFFGVFVRIATLMERVHPAAKKTSTILKESAASGLLALPFMLKLYALSIVRYVTMLVRVPALVAAFGLPLAMADAVQGFTLVQATQIAALTPGQLGIREWSWSGVLALRGYNLQLAAGFAIDLRIVGTIAMTLAALSCIGSVRARRSS